jgi:hypothetical protein
MQATRLRLRFVTGISVSGATYGSGNYGTQTYGQSATDPLAAYRYLVVPLPAGSPTNPSWLYRQHDSWPDFRARIVGDASTDLAPLDLAPVAQATLDLAPIDGQVLTSPLSFPLTVTAPATSGQLGRVWAANDLIEAGVYRALIVLTFTSGRRLTLPGDDNLRFVVTQGLPRS